MKIFALALALLAGWEEFRLEEIERKLTDLNRQFEDHKNSGLPVVAGGMIVNMNGRQYLTVLTPYEEKP